MKTKRKPRKVKRKNKPQKARVKKELAPIYMALCNQAVQCMFQDESKVVFTEECDILWTSGFIEKGAKKGFRLIQNDKYRLDPDCNGVCLSNAIIIYGIIKEGGYHKLSHLQKLYLFFVDYLNRADNDRVKQELPFEYAVKKIDKKLEIAKAYHKKKVDEKAKAKSIKTALKSIEKINIERAAIKDRYESWHKELEKYKADIAKKETGSSNSPPATELVTEQDFIAWMQGNPTPPPEIPRDLRVNVCGDTDCEFITGDYPGFIKAAQGDVDISKVIGIFCENMLYVFKGVIWLLMKEFSEDKIKTYSNGVVPRPSSDSKKVQLNLPIHSLVENTNCVMIPSAEIYRDPDTYEEEDGTLDEDDRWVYTNMKQNRSTDEYTMDKVPVKVLRDDTMYLTADLHRYTDLFTMNQFIEGEGVQPVLEYLERTFETLSNGLKVPQLREEIYNSITEHWYVSPLQSIEANVELNYDMMPPIGELGAMKKHKKKNKKKHKKKPKKKRSKKKNNRR